MVLVWVAALILGLNLHLLGPVASRLVEAVPGEPGFAWFLQYLSFGFIASHVSIAVHELGHATAARWRGLRVAFISVRRILISTLDGRLRLRRNPVLLTRGGMCCAFPGAKEPTRADLLWFIAAGPIASLLLAAAAFGTLYLGHLSVDSAKLALLLLGVLSSLHGLFNLVPTRSAPDAFARTDGAHLKSLLTEPDYADGLLMRMTITGLTYTGVRPRDWPSSFAEQEPKSEQLKRQLTSIRVAAMCDNGDYDGALELHTTLLPDYETLAPTNQKMFALGQSGLIALTGGDATEAREWFTKGESAPIDKHRIVSGEAAVLIAEGDSAKALVTLDRIPALWKEAIFPVSDYDREFRERLITRAKATLGEHKEESSAGTR